MSDFSSFMLRALLGVVLFLFLAAYPVFVYFDVGVYKALAVGAMTGLLVMLIAYGFNRRVFLARGARFLQVFFTGMILRFLIITIAVIGVAKLTKLNLVAYIAALLTFYFVLHIYEIKFINAQLAKMKKEEIK